MIASVTDCYLPPRAVHHINTLGKLPLSKMEEFPEKKNFERGGWGVISDPTKSLQIFCILNGSFCREIS